MFMLKRFFVLFLDVFVCFLQKSQIRAIINIRIIVKDKYAEKSNKKYKCKMHASKAQL